MAIFTIAGLTLKEAVRRKTLVGAFLLGLLVMGLSLLVSLIHYRMGQAVENGRMSQDMFVLRFPLARSAITALCISSIKSLGGLFAVLLAGGSVSSEIERGLLAVILPKPIPRWQILLGKWLGLVCILVGSVLVWTVMVWLSLKLQLLRLDPGLNLTPLLRAGPLLAVFPILVGTLTLSLSTFAQRLFGTSLALTLIVFAWLDGVFNALGSGFDVDTLHTIADVASLVVPQGYVAWWVERATEDIIIQPPSGRLGWESSQFLVTWGEKHLHFARLDALYILVYIVAVFLIGAVVFQKRDV